ncbi:MAG: RluA family pseudouridine synthase [Gracilibacteraceae bacterium]|jgi:23S rRNA pseudouridine1911/1915/1917 synthase|nr:RluA family pseudouridine synthase [Gracilibacteraceae bacterium]
MEAKEYIVSQEEVGERLDCFLAGKVEGYSRTYIQKLIEEGHCKVNGKNAKPKLKLHEGDKVEAVIPDPVPLEVVPEKIDLDIIYEDNDIIVINKPQGMVVHPAHGNYSGTVVNALMEHCSLSDYNSLTGINGIMRPGIVHRIDKHTSGLIVVAKNNEAHLSLSEQLKEHSITRKYIALLEGRLNSDNGKIETLIGRNPKNRKQMAVVVENGKKAVTYFRVIERFENHTLIEAELETGRTHQIRVHAAYLGHPLVGDTVYGYKKQRFETMGQLLHARLLGFIHPTKKEYVEFEAPIPEYFEKVLGILRNRCL